MNEKFFDLKKEKQDKMINGAMEVFAKRGYSKASTDDMVKVAGVSKGLWFHYFESKLGLYTFMVDYAVKYMIMEMGANKVGGSDNYFEVAMQLEATKVTLSRVYPFIPLLLESFVLEDDEEARKVIDSRIGEYYDKVTECFNGVKDSAFVKGVSRRQLDMTMGYTLGGMLKKSYNEDNFNGENYIIKVQEFLEMMSKICYN